MLTHETYVWYDWLIDIEAIWERSWLCPRVFLPEFQQWYDAWFWHSANVCWLVSIILALNTKKTISCINQKIIFFHSNLTQRLYNSSNFSSKQVNVHIVPKILHLSDLILLHNLSKVKCSVRWYHLRLLGMFTQFLFCQVINHIY